LNKVIKFLILLTIFLSGACRHRIPGEGNVHARIIDYKVTYLNDRAGNIPTSVLPQKMRVIFADHVALTRIDGFLGQFSLSYIANLKNLEVITMVKIFDKKFVYYGKPGELPVCIEPVQSMEITEQDNNVQFAGFNCRKLLISSSNYDNFYVLSTEEINVENPNATTSYKDIDEVLLMFNTRLSLLSMQLNAIRFEQKEVSWSIVDIPDDYQIVSRDDIERVIETLFK
jgi:hypothetical protein